MMSLSALTMGQIVKYMTIFVLVFLSPHVISARLRDTAKLHDEHDRRLHYAMRQEDFKQALKFSRIKKELKKRSSSLSPSSSTSERENFIRNPQYKRKIRKLRNSGVHESVTRRNLETDDIKERDRIRSKDFQNQRGSFSNSRANHYRSQGISRRKEDIRKLPSYSLPSVRLSVE